MLEGPPGLDRLDKLTVTLRDDNLDHTPITAGGPSPEQIARQVWGPYRFVTGVDGADETGRSIAPVMMQLGDGRSFSLEPTTSPAWSGDGAAWERQYEGSPIRLTFSCYREGHEEWTVPVEVNLDHGFTHGL